MKDAAFRERLLARFNSLWEPVTETGCWLWTSHTRNGRYGIFSIRNKHYLAHRFSFSEFIAPIPSGMCVCHRCDVSFCVNPGHLFLGTHADNMADKKRKGRVSISAALAALTPESYIRATLNRERKLGNEAIWAIRADHRAQRTIAADYGICQRTVSAVKRKIFYSYIPDKDNSQ